MPAVRTTTLSEPTPFGFVAEVPIEDPPALVHPAWRTAFPWLIQGTTRQGDPEHPFDLGLFSDASPAGAVLERWERLRRSSGVARVVHAHQVHGADVRYHTEGGAGFHLAEACDGHATSESGVLLAVTTADCVPVFVVDPVRRAVALLHAGWRGSAAGILEEGFALLAAQDGSPAADLHIHFGPAICGSCYEVGPEVFQALGLPAPDVPTPLDLRRALAVRAVEAGVPTERITVSSHCTLCGGSGLFSHRGGDRGRQIGFLGIREARP